MRKFLVLTVLFAMIIGLIPVMALSETTDECDRVGALIDNAEAMIDRAGPVILRSGNRQAISFYYEGVNHLHLARRAYNHDHCRLAFNEAQTAVSLVRRALRIINRPNSY